MLKKLILLSTLSFTMLLTACASQSVYSPVGSMTSAHATTSKTKGNVTIYGTGTCMNTIMTKLFMRDHKIPYHYYSVTSSRKGAIYYSKIGAPGVPVITIGKQQIIGYNKPDIIKALRSNGYHISS